MKESKDEEYNDKEATGKPEGEVNEVVSGRCVERKGKRERQNGGR